MALLLPGEVPTTTLVESQGGSLRLALPDSRLEVPGEGAQRLLAAHSFLSAGGVGQQLGWSTGNPGKKLAEWAHKGVVVRVPVGLNRWLYPMFQFDAFGQPHPAIAGVIKAMGEGSAERWGTAMWLANPNPRLRDRTPVSLLASSPKQVVAAAVRDFDPEAL